MLGGQLRGEWRKRSIKYTGGVLDKPDPTLSMNKLAVNHIHHEFP